MLFTGVDVGCSTWSQKPDEHGQLPSQICSGDMSWTVLAPWASQVHLSSPER